MFTPIGTIHTHFRKKYDAPRQPLPEEQAVKRLTEQEGVITLYPHLNYEQALTDLAGFERIWLLYIFHNNLVHWKPKVLPPRGRIKRGVFATRAPYRPNPLGISVLTLKEIRGLQLFVGNCDVLDGTPILDIKPYIPEYDAFTESRAGWWDNDRANEQTFTIKTSPKAAEQLTFLSQHGIFLLESVRHILERDPFPHPYHRIRKVDAEYFEIAHKDWRLRYVIEQNEQENIITIVECASGYSAETLHLLDEIPLQAIHARLMKS